MKTITLLTLLLLFISCEKQAIEDLAPVERVAVIELSVSAESELTQVPISQSTDGVITISSIGGLTSQPGIQIIITKPLASAFAFQLDDTINQVWSGETDNSLFEFEDLGSAYRLTLSGNNILSHRETLRIGFIATAQNVLPGSYGTVHAYLIDYTAGDNSLDNNYATVTMFV